QVMSRIRGKNTRPEIALRKALFARGFRYRLHCREIPGRPDLVFPRRRAVIFVNGCFWHGHNCPLFKWPTENSAFWRRKILGNRKRDRRVRKLLSVAGWRVMTVWECAIRKADPALVEVAANQLEKWLRSLDGRPRIVSPADIIYEHN